MTTRTMLAMSLGMMGNLLCSSPMMELAARIDDKPAAQEASRPHGSAAPTIRIDEDTIQFFKDEHFKDDFVPLEGVTRGHPANKPTEPPGDIDNALSSVRWNLPPGVVVMLYEDAGSKGEQLALWGAGEMTALTKLDFNDKVSRWSWYYVGGVANPSEHLKRAQSSAPRGAADTSASVPENSLQLFRDKNFKDTMVPVDRVTAEPPGKLHSLPGEIDDSMTSLRWNLPPGVVVVFYQDAGGLKQQAAIWGKGEIDDIDIWDFNDKVSRWAWYHVGDGKNPLPRGS